jgi:hypothetical protein
MPHVVVYTPGLTPEEIRNERIIKAIWELNMDADEIGMPIAQVIHVKITRESNILTMTSRDFDIDHVWELGIKVNFSRNY